MADVISDIGSTNGELKEDNDEIRVNGDKCDNVLEPEEESGSEDAASDVPSNKKVISDVSAVDRLHDLKDKCSPTIANGHLKLADSADVKSKSAYINSESTDSAGASSVAPVAKPSSDEQNEDLSAELENDDEEDEDEEEEDEDDDDVNDDGNNCDSGPLNFAQNSKHLDENSDVLNLKADSSNISCSNSNSSHDKHELCKTTVSDDKTESSSAELMATDLSEDRLQKSDADHHQVENSSGSVDLNKTNEEHDDSMSSEGSSEKRKYVKKSIAANLTPRRSSRNLNKQKNYSEKETAEFEAAAANSISTSTPKNKGHEDDEIEEVTPTDPLADDSKARMRPNKTIVVSDTKGLVEFASSTKMPRSNKKEPTLVIIDTNSILSGRGPVPISQSVNSSNLHSSSSSAPIPVSLPIPAGALSNANRGVPASTSAFSVIPIGIPTQGMYPQYKNPPPQMKPIVVGPASTTVTPITIQPVSSGLNNSGSHSGGGVTVISGAGAVHGSHQQSIQNASSKQPPIILPSLTDDMFVVEAPSFIVPYVYEKPPMKSLKDYIEKLAVEVREAEEKERQEREEKEKLEKERLEKERAEAEEKQKEAAAAEEANKAADAAASKDESMDVDDESSEKSVDKMSTDSKVDASGDTTNASKAEASEKDATALQMEVDEEVDPDAPKVTSENDVVLASSKKVDDADAPKKEESAATPSTAAATPAAPKEAEKKVEETKKPPQPQPLSYFDNPLGKFFMQIGLNLVQEHVQTDLLRSQKRKRDKEGDKCSSDVKLAIETLSKTLESSKENNDPFKLEMRKCELCSFKTESILVMAHHLETPHMKNYTYRCNFCPFEVRSPHDILFHMESEHNIRGRLERAPAFHQCPNCPFEDNQKGKLTRHMVSCSKKYRPERNQEPPLDWEPPAKIPRVTRNRPPSMSPGNAVYQAAMSGLKQVPQNSLLPKLMPTAAAANMKQPPNMMNMNKRPNAVPANFVQRFPNAVNQSNFQQRSISVPGANNQGIMYRSPGPNSQTQVILPQNYQLSGAQIYQQSQNVKQQPAMQPGLAAAKLLNQPSISITPLPRQSSNTQPSTSSNQGNVNMKPGKPPGPGGKNSFVVCEICDSGIKDLEQLRNHMQWIHKVKIHPKMIYNRPPLNCQKCQFRFFTDQGLERHLLGSHGLVTSSMQEAANKGKDSGRCPVCGRVYQWKLLNHVARDHQMALKPAHLSYKCTVCTATFGMYKQFESHVYSAHSVVAKRAMDTKKPPVIPPSSSSQDHQNDQKLDDEKCLHPEQRRHVDEKCHNREHERQLQQHQKLELGEQSADDFEICTKECVAADFESESKYREHMQRHVQPVAVRVPPLDLSQLSKIPNSGLGTYRLPKEPPKMLDMHTRVQNRAEVVPSGFRVELINYTCLSKDCVYEVVRRDVNVQFLVPITTLVVLDTRNSSYGIGGGAAAAAIADTIDLSFDDYIRVGEPYAGAAQVMAPATPAFPVLQQVTQQQQYRRRHLLPAGVQELATVTGMPADYCQELLSSFGASHFILNDAHAPRMIKSYAPLLPKSAPAKNHQGPVVVQRKKLSSSSGKSRLNSMLDAFKTLTGSPQIHGAHSVLGTKLLQSSKSAAPKQVYPTLDASSTSGHKPSFSHHTTSSVDSTSILRKVMTNSVSREFCSGALPSSTPTNLVASTANNSSSSGGGGINGDTTSSIPQTIMPIGIVSNVRSLSNNYKIPKIVSVDNCVAKRTPLTMRQPPYAKVATENWQKSVAAPSDPVFVSVAGGLRSPTVTSNAGASDVIDLLSDDENGECEIIDENASNEVIELD